MSSTIDSFVNKRKFYHKQDYILDEINNRLILSPKFHKELQKNQGTNLGFRKISGTYFGDIFETDLYKSKFNAYLRLTGLALPSFPSKYLTAGIFIEPKILEYIEQETNDVLQRFNPEECSFDYFKDNKFFGGLPDGFSKSKNKIYEIKTTSIKNFAHWNTAKDIPQGYVKQAQLYAYLMKAKTFEIVVCFLEDKDYENPNEFVLQKQNIKTFAFELDEKLARKEIAIAFMFWKKYLKIGQSPNYSNSQKNLTDILDYLRCSNAIEYKQLLSKWVDSGKVKLNENQID
ncbi:MAGa7180 family putative nuclease [Metamycoplasma equirhinis]|uniref:MAGa7180 family putative nuclease n=1 Tax=Metamycoplasma equirhinis TaxID=92402 RepID=UPI0035942995